MPEHTITVECDVPESFNVQKVAGMFDVPLSKRAGETFSVELPEVDEDWSIGVIVGPSGSGKSTVAREVFGRSLYSPRRWPPDKAVIDAFGDREVGQITHTLTAVGFSSPPAWIKPYRVLSNGEQFRCDLARALLADKPLVVFDEFTSVVDRTVAKIGSAAVSKSIRSGKIKRKFIAVTCHYDVVEWLEPDWVLDMAGGGALSRRRLRRPGIELKIFRGGRALWPLFARHHYLSATLSPSARCYYATMGGQLAAICAFLPVLGRRGRMRVSRIVVLPDYQGVGIGSWLLSAACSLVKAEEKRVSITTSHPAMIAHLKRSTDWRVTGVKKTGAPKPGWKSKSARNYRASTGRAVISAEFLASQVKGEST